MSGPFLDRIDMIVNVPRLNRAELRNEMAKGESSASIRGRVERARSIQQDRQQSTNALLDTTELERHCQLKTADAEWFDTVSEKLNLSLRSHVRVIKLARTIADLSVTATISREHLMEAVSYRNSPMVK